MSLYQQNFNLQAIYALIFLKTVGQTNKHRVYSSVYIYSCERVNHVQQSEIRRYAVRFVHTKLLRQQHAFIRASHRVSVIGVKIQQKFL